MQEVFEDPEAGFDGGRVEAESGRGRPGRAQRPDGAGWMEVAGVMGRRVGGMLLMVILRFVLKARITF